MTRIALLLLVGLVTLLAVGLAPAGQTEAVPPPSATVTVSPDPVTAGNDFLITGTAFKPGRSYIVGLTVGWCCFWATVTADANGNWTQIGITRDPGTETVTVWKKKPTGFKGKIVASLSYTVVP